MWLTVLKLSIASLLYVIMTAALWYFFDKRKPYTRGIKVLIGLIYGACSVLANHFGIRYEALILNVRDIGPLAAGLFFSPVSGIIAGVIGGAERILAGEVWNIGRFTEVACAMSTCLAGFLAAFLHVKVYYGRRPTVPHAFFLGALMEVFHMYAVLFTNRANTTQAYAVVRIASMPMIAFTAIGLALCSVAIRILSKSNEGGFGAQEEEIPIAVHFQRWLLVVTIVLFSFNFAVSYQFQTRLVTETATQEVRYLARETVSTFENTHSIEELNKNIQQQHELQYVSLLVDLRDGHIRNLDEFLEEEPVEFSLEQEDVDVLRDHLDQDPFFANLEAAGSESMLCYVVSIGSNHALAILRTASEIYEDLHIQMYENTLSDILLFTVLFVLTAMLVEHLVVKNLQRVNVSLDKITQGNLDEVVWVRTSSEFTELSDDINKTVTALKGYIDEAEEKMEQELKLAAAIQESALPRNFRLPTEQIELFALMTPAKQVGGDFYDFFYVDIDKICFVIADVSGKGVPASLFMMRAKTAIKNYAQDGLGAAKVRKKANNALCEGNDAQMFVTVWIGILDVKTGLMQCANAGHEYPVIMRKNGNYELYKDKHGLVLGALENVPVKDYDIQMSPGDRLFVYTDGVPEAINEKNEPYGTERMIERLNRLKNWHQERILEEMLQDIRNFAGTAEQFDDITMLGMTLH